MRCEFCDHDYTAHISKGDVNICLICVIKWVREFGDHIPRQQLLFLKDKKDI